MVAVPKPRWTTSSYLMYAGAITVLEAAIAALVYLATQYGDAALSGWAFLVFAVLAVVALGFRRRGAWLVAGVFAFVDVLAFAGLVVALWAWWGWVPSNDSSPFGGFDLSLLGAVLAILIAALVALRVYRHPLLVSLVAGLSWFFVTSVVSNGGNWSAVVTLLIGLVYLLVGRSLDRGPRRPYGFWLHLAAGLTIGGSLLFWWHGGDTHWSLVCVASLVYIAIGHRTRRSSWAVFGTIGFLAAASHFSTEWAHGASISFSPSAVDTFQGWVPALVFAFVGFLFVVLGLASHRRNPADALPAAEQ
jgi:hypothetical protein